MNIMTAVELIGTVAFAVSGVLVGIGSGLDIFGVLFLGVMTATGGGIVRDCMIGKFPPSVFSESYLIAAAAGAAALVFLAAFIKRKEFIKFKERTERINNIFDAAGLAAFSVSGARIAFDAGFGDNMLFAVLMGMMTGVGGGIARDVLADKTPYVLKKHIYALASVAGSMIYCIIRKNFGESVYCTVISALSVFVIRMLATKFRWKLPRIELFEESNGKNE